MSRIYILYILWVILKSIDSRKGPKPSDLKNVMWNGQIQRIYKFGGSGAASPADQSRSSQHWPNHHPGTSKLTEERQRPAGFRGPGTPNLTPPVADNWKQMKRYLSSYAHDVSSSAPSPCFPLSFLCKWVIPISFQKKLRN